MNEGWEYLNDNGIDVQRRRRHKNEKKNEDHDENDAVKLSSIPVSIFDPMVFDAGALIGCLLYGIAHWNGNAYERMRIKEKQICLLN